MAGGNFPGAAELSVGQAYGNYVDKGPFVLGGVGYDKYGRKFRYARVGASTALIGGRLNQSTAPDANLDELALPSAFAIGTKEINITLGATQPTLNQLIDGWLNVEDDTGEGILYPIISNDGAATTAQVVIEPGLLVATTTATTVGIWPSPYALEIIHPSPNTAMLTGVSCRAVSASYYHWAQVQGMASILGAGTLVIGKTCYVSETVDGAVDPTIANGGTLNDVVTVGMVHEVAATTEEGTIWMMLN